MEEAIELDRAFTAVVNLVDDVTALSDAPTFSERQCETLLADRVLDCAARQCRDR